MKKFYLLFCCVFFITLQQSIAQTTGPGSRMNEVFSVKELTHPPIGNPVTSPNTRFYDPWEVAYGPDDSLWITEAKGYKVYKISPNGGTPRLILDISQYSTFLPTAQQTFNLQFTLSNGGGYSGGSAPQGGLAGLAIHPQYLSGKPYVFISYIKKFDSVSATANGGVFYRNSLVRFTFNSATGLLGSPVMVCDTLPGSSDHNSQRIIIAPVSGTNYLFYANGDMGAGQFGNAKRKENAQTALCYEGKILRFNLDPDTDPGAYDQWIPSDNPFNGTAQSAIWSLGIRNNQGFAYANINGTDYLYGQSHGPFSDDEINIIQKAGNYGHPLVIGYAADGNYNSAAAGNPTASNGGGLPLITSESANAAALTNYHDPIYCFYAAVQGSTSSPSSAPTNTIQRMYYDFNHSNQSNTYWPSESPSGLDIYTKSIIPGWKNSLLSAVLKGAPGAGGGRVLRLSLNSNGDGIVTTSSHNTDTTGYFGSVNRFRDIAISPDGRSIFAVIDSSAVTSGPTAANPMYSQCRGCLFKFTFRGYNDNGTTSMLPDTINVSTGATNNCVYNANTVSITPADSNTNVWVPITDSNSNIIAELYANGNNLGTITTSYYVNSGTVRETGSNHSLYLNRNITITPANQPTSGNVKVRLYITNAEFNALKGAKNSQGASSNVTTISSVGIFKNHDACGSTFTSSPLALTATYTHPRIKNVVDSNGFVLQTNVTSFSTFYFASNTAPLALHLLSFTGSLVDDISQLQWVTESENGTKNFVVERSVDENNFYPVGTVAANNIEGKSTYHFPDASVSKLSCAIVYYRLRIVDADGKFSYSNIVAINLPGVAGAMFIRPNPVTTQATIEIDAAVTENANWQLIDNMGRMLMQKNIFLTKGVNTFTINMSNMPTGVYYLKAIGNVINQQIKFEKLSKQ